VALRLSRFVGVFGEPGDEGSADADAILHAAND
jgi:hypothetical protein